MSFKPDKYTDVKRKLLELIDDLHELKPEERGEEARYAAIVITDLEKVLAFIEYYLRYR